MKIFDCLFESVAKTKVFLARAVSYISIINFIMIFATFKQAYNIPISSFILVPIGVIGALLIGYLDYKFILLPETRHNNRQNNVKHQIDRIEKDVILIKNTLKKNCGEQENY